MQRAASASAFYPEVVDGRLRSLGSLAGWALLIFAILRLVGHGTVLSGSLQSVRFGDLGDLITNSTFGRGWLLQMLATISLLVALRSRPSVRRRLAFVAVAGVTVAAAMLGHAAAVTGLGILPIGVDASHALAAGGWAGGIIVLAVAVLPAMARVAEGERLMVARSVLRAFSPLALACAGILAVTGVMSAWLQLRDLNLLLNSPYGLALTRKLVFVLLIGAVGAYHWRVAQPSLATNGAVQRLRVSLASDATLVALVLVLTAMLTGTSPPPR